MALMRWEADTLMNRPAGRHVVWRNSRARMQWLERYGTMDGLVTPTHAHAHTVLLGEHWRRRRSKLDDDVRRALGRRRWALVTYVRANNTHYILCTRPCMHVCVSLLSQLIAIHRSVYRKQQANKRQDDVACSHRIRSNATPVSGADDLCRCSFGWWRVDDNADLFREKKVLMCQMVVPSERKMLMADG
jgi:hypothetical protein